MGVATTLPELSEWTLSYVGHVTCRSKSATILQEFGGILEVQGPYPGKSMVEF